MDRIEKSGTDNNEGFIKTVFPFDDEQKNTLLNVVQYSLLNIIPILILLRLIKNYIPETDEDKSSLAILAEVVGQLLAMVIGLYFINRIIHYIPTYSGKPYDSFSMINIIPPILFLSLTIQSKMGEKIQILIDRLFDLYEGNTKKPDDKKQVNTNPNVRITQPLSQQYVTAPSTIDKPPELQSQMTNMKSETNEYSIPQSPDFNSMYAGPNTPLVNANTPSMESMAPMAANDFIGGGFGTPF
tara:strand:+ start:7589 stop:8314 length:726 start_codon:yes stop_codon:yes gene_type:complete